MGLGLKPEDSVNWCPRELGLCVCAGMGDDVQLRKVFRYFLGKEVIFSSEEKMLRRLFEF